jgi:major type 1 subunit fimbrin (pilin)
MFKAAFPGRRIVASDGNTYEVFPTTLAGVGLVSKFTSNMSRDGKLNHAAGLHQASVRSDRWYALLAVKSNPGANGIEVWGHATSYAFIKTGPITGGVATVSGHIATAGMGVEPYPTGYYTMPVNVSGSASFVVLSCATPDVTVDLGQHRDSDFPSSASRRGISGPYSEFDIGLFNCGAGMTSISYALRPLNGEVSTLPGAVRITPGSTARGVAVRIADRNDIPVAFNTERAVGLTTYSASTGGNQKIPLRAWIERIGWSDFAGGSVQAQVEFTMTYR